MILRTLISLLVLSSASLVWAKPIKRQVDPEMRELVRGHNRRLAESFDSFLLDLPYQNAVPFSEYDRAGYLMMSSDFDFDSSEAKRELLRNLPADVQAIVYTGDEGQEEIQRVRAEFEDVIESERLHVVYIPGARKGFWTRDAVPVPLLNRDQGAPSPLAVVDALYYHRFEGDAEIAAMFDALVSSHKYYFEGGNFMPNHKGDCLTVDNELSFEIPDAVFETYYGCKRLIRLPFVKGIGHVDESVRFVDDTRVLTDEPKYVDVLKAHGFEVIMLPRPEGEFETYVNSLYINGTVYVPVFGGEKDADALAVYEQLGWKVVALPSVELSNYGQGSIHCITMTYPKVPLKQVLQFLESLGSRKNGIQ